MHVMPTFTSKPLNPNNTFRRHPTWFGIPFILIMVAASFGIQQFTQTRYDLHARKVTELPQEELQRLKRSRKRVDVREEYFKLQAKGNPDWEPVRVPRPKGVPEWGVPPEGYPDGDRPSSPVK